MTNIDLIVKGTVDGQQRGLLFQPGPNNLYRSDKTGVGPFTRSQLMLKIQAGDNLTFMGVPPGSGYRMGIDHDVNGVLDGDAPQPSVQITKASTETIIAWPVTAYNYLLEKNDALGGTNWMAETSLRGTNGSLLTVTNSVGLSSNLFFRVKQL